MITADELQGLDLVLNEAELGPLHVDRQLRRAQIHFRSLMLSADGTEPDDRVLTLCLTGISRIAASLRDGNWNDTAAAVLPLELDGLSDSILSFSTHIYGWQFFDQVENDWSNWKNRLSFDEHLAEVPATHYVDLFQEGGGVRHLDFRIWFEDAWIQRRGTRPSLEDVIASSRRWWDAMYAGDPIAAKHGTIPAGNPRPKKRTPRWWNRKQ